MLVLHLESTTELVLRIRRQPPTPAVNDLISPPRLLVLVPPIVSPKLMQRPTLARLTPESYPVEAPIVLVLLTPVRITKWPGLLRRVKLISVEPNVISLLLAIPKLGLQSVNRLSQCILPRIFYTMTEGQPHFR